MTTKVMSILAKNDFKKETYDLSRAPLEDIHQRTAKGNKEVGKDFKES